MSETTETPSLDSHELSERSRVLGERFGELRGRL